MVNNLPSVAILLLRGLEGCGVTTYCRHLKAYYDFIGAKCEIFVLQEKKIGRGDTSTDINTTSFNFNERVSLVNRINSEFDLTLVFSVPAKSFSDEIKNRYVEEILIKLKQPKWMVNLDHHMLSFSRNASYKEAIEACDGVLCYSLNETKSGFVNWLKKNDVKTTIKNIDNFIHVPFLEDKIFLDREDRKKRIIYAGRAVAWKRGSLSLNLHKFAAKRKFISEMIGFERSIAGFTQLNNYEGKLTWFTDNNFYKAIKGPSAFSSARINNQLFDYLDEIGQDPDLMYVIGSYDYKRGLQRISESGFAIHSRSFEHNNLDYGNNFEFQGLEAALLTIPIFHRHFLNTVTLPNSTTTLQQTGVFLSIDDDNRHLKEGGPQVLEAEKFVSLLEETWNDVTEYYRRRRTSVDLIKTFYSSEVVVPKLISKLT